MKQGKNGQLIIIAVLAVAILVMSVGFAQFAQNLNVDGTVTVTPVHWSVHWDTSTFTTSTGSVTLTNPNCTETVCSFSAALAAPGDFAEFTIKAVNDGDFDAALKSVTLTDVSSYKYLRYTLTYGTIQFSSTSTNINNVILAKKANNVNGEENVKVRVEYVLPTDSSDLPQGNNPINVNLTATLAYEQA